MPNSHQRARAHPMRTAGMQSMNLVRFELPADNRLEIPDEVCNTRVYEQSWRIHFQILAFHVELLATRTEAIVRPLAAGTKVRGRVDHVEIAFHTPPLRALLHIGNGFEDAGWRSRNKYLRQDRVLIRSNVRCCCHLCPRCDGFSALSIRLQPNKSQVPAVSVVLGCFGVACEAGVSKF